MMDTQRFISGIDQQSQPGQDEQLAYMDMPQDMRTFVPHILDPELAKGEATVIRLLKKVADACGQVARDGAAVAFAIDDLGEQSLVFLTETLGSGEVSLKQMAYENNAGCLAQESIFAGVWHVVGKGKQHLEVATIPAVVLKQAFAVTRPPLLDKAGEELARRHHDTAGLITSDSTAAQLELINAPSLLTELRDLSASWQPDMDSHQVNLSLLPHSPADLSYLDLALGTGSVSLLSRGYGNCRVTACGLPYVWRVQYFNSMDKLILDIYEVCQVPEVVLAAREDLLDSGERLHKVLDSLA